MTQSVAPLRIAYLTGEYPAVSHTFILREVEALRDRGFEVMTCSIRETGPEHHRGPSEKHAAETTFYVLSNAKNPSKFLRGFGAALKQPRALMQALRLAWATKPPGLKASLWQLFYLAEALVLARHLKDEGVQHLHNHFGNSSCSVAMLTSVLSGIPFSYTMHGPAIFFEPRIWRIDEKIARAKFVACISHFCRSQGMIFAAPQHWPKMRIVHCAIHPQSYGQAPDRTPGKDLVFVGRLAAVKGVPILIEAFATIRAQHPGARLTLVGDGVERSKIEALIAKLGCQDAIRLTGYLSQEEVADILSRSDGFVLPSFAEGVPVVLMEAMATGLPVIATRIAGIGELVEDGISGYIVPPGDVASLAEAMDKMLTSAEQRAKMGAAGRAKVEADYNLPKEAAWLDTLLKDPLLDTGLRPQNSSSDV